MIFLTTICGFLFWTAAIVSVAIFLANETSTMRTGVYLASVFWVGMYLGFKLLEVATLLSDSGLVSW